MRWVLLALGTAALAAGIILPAIGHIEDPSSGTSLLQFAWGEPTLDGVSVFARVTVEGNLTSAQVTIVVAVLIAAWCWTRWRPWGWIGCLAGIFLFKFTEFTLVDYAEERMRWTYIDRMPWTWTCSVVGFTLLAASWWPRGSRKDFAKRRGCFRRVEP